jgi:hypothetical protein
VRRRCALPLRRSPHDSNHDDEAAALDTMARLYGPPGPPTPDRVAELAEPWRPFRTWAAVLIRAAASRLPAEVGAGFGAEVGAGVRP